MIANLKITLWILGAAVAASLLIVWLVYFNTPEPAAQPPAQSLGEGQNLVPVTPGGTNPEGESEALPVIETASGFGIIKLHNGPVAGAALLQTTRPTTTVARFMLQNNGHAFDLVVDSPGAIPKAISNTTIPGIAKVLWAPGARAALVQYLDGTEVKTASFALPPAAATTTSPVRVQFLPAGIRSVAVSPDGTRAAYLLAGNSGAEGYVADINGGSARRVFSLPLQQMSISWPTDTRLLAVSAPATGAGGIAFSIDASTGTQAPLLFADGLTAIANRTFGTMIYQTAGAAKTTYAYNTETERSRPLSFTPLPEQCVWGRALFYCPVALQYTEPNYVDLFNLGLSSIKSGIAAYNTTTGQTALIAAPGEDGGEEAEIAEIALSPDESYILYIRKGDRSLWGVRLK